MSVDLFQLIGALFDNVTKPAAELTRSCSLDISSEVQGRSTLVKVVRGIGASISDDFHSWAGYHFVNFYETYCNC